MLILNYIKECVQLHISFCCCIEIDIYIQELSLVLSNNFVITKSGSINGR